MRERINRLLGEAVATSSGWKGLTIGTFHSICAYILRQEAPAIGSAPTSSFLTTATNWPPCARHCAI